MKNFQKELYKAAYFKYVLSIFKDNYNYKKKIKSPQNQRFTLYVVEGSQKMNQNILLNFLNMFLLALFFIYGWENNWFSLKNDVLTLFIVFLVFALIVHYSFTAISKKIKNNFIYHVFEEYIHDSISEKDINDEFFQKIHKDKIKYEGKNKYFELLIFDKKMKIDVKNEFVYLLIVDEEERDILFIDLEKMEVGEECKLKRMS